MTTAGGGGAATGDDYVALRLNLDIPQEATKGIQDIAAEVERYKVAMEAAVRAEADMASYADKMAESTKKAAEAQEDLTKRLETYLQLSGKMSGGATSSGVPAGPHQAPWDANTAGTGAAPVPPGARMPNPSDVVYQLGDKAGGHPKDAAGYLNMQRAHGNVPDTISISADSIQALATQIADREKAAAMGQKSRDGSDPQRPAQPSQRHPSQSDPYDQFEDRVDSYSGLAKQVMNEMSTGKGFGHMALDGINFARKQLEQRQAQTNAQTKPDGGTSGDPNSNPEDDGGIGGLAKGLGIAGGILGVALAGYGLVQKGGQMIQGWRNIAGERGGAAGQGFQLSLRADELAMDPMIGQDQARQIYQAMLSEGYSNASGSGGFGPNSADDIKNFYKNGIKNWNMDVSEGTELLRLSAKGTKISLVELAQGMDQLKRQAALPGGLSLSDQKRMAMEYTAQLESQGVSPEAAWRSALAGSSYFAQDPELQGSMMNPVSRRWGDMERIYGGPGGSMLPGMEGVDPQFTDEYLQEMGPNAEQNASLETARRMAKFYKKHWHDNSDNTKELKYGDPGFKQWFNAAHNFAKWLTTSGSQWAKLPDTAKISLYNQLCNDQSYEKIKKDAKEQQDKMTTELTPTEHKAPGVTVHTPWGDVGAHLGQSTWSSDPEDKIRKVFGDQDIKVVDEAGNVSDFDPHNEQQARDLGTGKLRWKRAEDSGKGITIAETPDKINKDFSTDDPNNPAGVGDGKSGDKNNQVTGTLHIKIDKEGNVTAPSSVPLTPNEAAAKQGVGTAQVNNPPVGDSISAWWPR